MKKAPIIYILSLLFLFIPIQSNQENHDEGRLIQFPSNIQLKYDFSTFGFGNFIDNTDIIQDLAYTKKTSQEVMHIVEKAYHLYEMVMPEQDVRITKKAKSLLIRLLLTHYSTVPNVQATYYPQQ